MTLIIKKIKQYYVPIILFFLAICYTALYLMHGGILAYGESSIWINPSYVNYFSMWIDKLNFGSVSANQSNILLYSVFWHLLRGLSFLADPSVLFIFLSVFLSALFMYICLDQILNFQNKFIYLPACLLYSYNTFRILGPLNERLNLLFVFLPLFFLLYYKLLHSRQWKYVFWLVIISILSSSMGANLPVFSIPYLLMLLYFAYFILFSGQFKKIWKAMILQNLVLVFLIAAANIFWIYPLAVNLLIQYKQTNGGSSIFSATSAGSLFNHFRLIGSWAWNTGSGGYPYYPFASSYDKPFLLFTTYFISIFSFIYIFSLKIKDLNVKFKIFCLSSALLSLLLMSGQGQFGSVFNFLYNNIPLFKMYREPFAKFTPLFIFFISFGLVFSITYFVRRFNIKKQWIFITILSFLILINAYPLFTTEAMPIKKWNGSKADNLIKIPDYWKNVKNYINKNKMDQRLMLFPLSGYGNSYLWEQGANTDANFAAYYLDQDIATAWTIDNSDVGLILKGIFDKKNSNVDIAKMLGLFNVEHILQENDKDWRTNDSWTPSKSNDYLKNQGFNEEQGFGEFTAENLKAILNYKELEHATKTKQIINGELVGRQALIMYQVDNKNFLPHFYTPKNTIVSSGTVKDILGIITSDQWQTRSVLFFEDQNAEKIDKLKSLSSREIESANLPVLEFKKISSTKYRIVVHGAKDLFPLVFSESFHSGWKAYAEPVQDIKIQSKDDLIDKAKSYSVMQNNEDDQATEEELMGFINSGIISNLGKNNTPDFVSKNFQGTIQNDNLDNGSISETWFKTPIDEKNHLKVNGYANSWFVDPATICNDNTKCIKNSDGSYDMELVVEFWPQRLFYLGLLISGGTLFGCIVYLVFCWRKTKRIKNAE